MFWDWRREKSRVNYRLSRKRSLRFKTKKINLMKQISISTTIILLVCLANLSGNSQKTLSQNITEAVASEGRGNGQRATVLFCSLLPWSKAPSFKSDPAEVSSTKERAQTEGIWKRSKSSSQLVTIPCSLFPVPCSL